MPKRTILLLASTLISPTETLSEAITVMDPFHVHEGDRKVCREEQMSTEATPVLMFISLFTGSVSRSSKEPAADQRGKSRSNDGTAQSCETRSV